MAVDAKALQTSLVGSALLVSSACGMVSTAADAPSIPTGREAAQLNCSFENGFNICPPLQETYLKLQELLGPPISGFDIQKREQCFLFGCLVYNPGNEKDWQVQLINVGTQELRLKGIPIKNTPEIHQAVREIILNEQEHSIDTTRTIGRIISDPIIDKDGKLIQLAEKVGFKIDLTSGQAQRLPLGLSYIHAPVAPPQKPIWESLGMAPIAIALVLVGLVFLVKRASGSRIGGGTL